MPRFAAKMFVEYRSIKFDVSSVQLFHVLALCILVSLDWSFLSLILVLVLHFA